MRPAPPPFQPFNPRSPHCAALIARWAALHDAAPGPWSFCMASGSTDGTLRTSGLRTC
jgi:hypothetical protein